MKKFVGKTLDVLVETNKDGYSFGHTTNYLEVKINGGTSPASIVPVVIKEIDYPYCIGEVKSAR